MKLSSQIASLAGSLALLGAGAASATILHYTFDAGSYYEPSGGDKTPITGSFDYDPATLGVTNVDFHNGADVFTVGSSDGLEQVYFGVEGTSNYDVLQFATSLALGGTDMIASGTHPAVYIDAGGSVTAASGAVPEPASWALMLAGFGLVGGAIRSRKLAVAA